MKTQDWSAMKNHFPELRKLIAAEGLFDKKPLRYLFAFSLTTVAFFIGFFALTQRQESWFLLGLALYMGIVSSQFGYLMHDAGHRQVFKRDFWNQFFGYIATFFNGSSFQTWVQDHNEHHEHPNHEDSDPDIDIFFLMYSEKQVDGAHPVMQYLARFQAYYALLIYTFVAHFMRYGAVLRKMKHLKNKRVIPLDASLIVAWHVLYYGGLFFVLGFWKTVLFTLVHQAVTGFILGMAFAPNHKGMPLFAKDANLNWFVRQVCTARNIHPNILVDTLYGGLNYQIEHHLFPTMPRTHLRAAHRITKDFCARNGVDYHETGIIESYAEVLGALNEVSSYARSLGRSIEDVEMHLALSLEKLKRDLSGLFTMPNFGMSQRYGELCANIQKRTAELDQQLSRKSERNRVALHSFRKEIREMKRMLKQMRLEIG